MSSPSPTSVTQATACEEHEAGTFAEEHLAYLSDQAGHQ